MKRLLRWSALVVVSAIVLVTGYGILIEPRVILDVDRHEVGLPRLGDDWGGTDVAVVADFQVGMWFANTGMMEDAVERILEDRPDFVLLAGDFIYGSGDPAPKIEIVMDLLDPLTASGIPVYAVLGNHDYKAGGAEELTTALVAAGIPVLQNEAVRLPAPGGDTAEALYLVGIGPLRPGLQDVDAALDGVPQDAARLVLMHNPLTFLSLPAGSAPFSVAGHTHCGQIALPFSEHWSWLGISAEEKVVADDWAEDGYGAPGNALYVTCGLGFSLVPMRVNAPPEVTFFELQPG